MEESDYEGASVQKSVQKDAQKDIQKSVRKGTQKIENGNYLGDTPFVEALGDSVQTRVLLFFIAFEGTDYSITEISSYTGASRQYVSRGITRLLRWKLIVQSRRCGNSRMYTLNSESSVVAGLLSVIDGLADIVVAEELKAPVPQLPKEDQMALINGQFRRVHTCHHCGISNTNPGNAILDWVMDTSTGEYLEFCTIQCWEANFGCKWSERSQRGGD